MFFLVKFRKISILTTGVFQVYNGGRKERFFMNKYNYIGEEVWHLTPYFDKNGETYFDDGKKAQKFKDCSVQSINSAISRGRVDVLLKNNNKIRIERGCACFVAPIENGYLAGSFVLVVEDEIRSKNSVYVLNDNRVLHFTDVDGELGLADLDQMVSNNYLVHSVAAEMNTFDTNNRMQWYQIMLSDLPQSCLADPNFKKDVLKVFSRIGDIELKSNVAREFINVDYCKKHAENYFKRECEKYSGIEIVR